MLKKFLTTGKRRAFNGPPRTIFYSAAGLFALWVAYANLVAIPDALEIGALFVCGIYAFLFLAIGAHKEVGDRPTWYDWLLCAASIACAIYIISIRADLVNRITLLDELTFWQLFFGSLLLLLTIEATRRTTGPGLTALVVLFLAYNLWGHLLPPPFGHGYIDFASFIDVLMYTTDGIYTVPIQVAASYVFLFVMFGAILAEVGGAEFLYQMAAALTGKTAGGPAKIAVVSSGLYGMISGSPTSDVVTTGSVTIPVMKRVGYSSRFAGAVEVAASTGGAAMPPIMGSAAFILVEYTGIDYRTVAIAALMPALFYYLCVYLQVHIRAVRRGLAGVDDVDPVLDTLKTGWAFFIPLAVITIALLLGYTPTYVAMFGTIALMLSSFFNPRTRLTWKRLVEGLGETTLRMLAVAGACAAAGLVVGGLTMTGLAMKGAGIVALSGQVHIILLLLVGAVVTIILGMGMPTPSAYILAAVVVGPAFMQSGLPVFESNMFLMYFAMMSALTPPVAVAAFAASGLADEDAMKIATRAVPLAFFGFFLPFVFIWNPAILAVSDSVANIAIAYAGGVIGVILIAHAIESHVKRRYRILMFAYGAALFSPYPLLVGALFVIFLTGVAIWKTKWPNLRFAQKDMVE